MLRSYPLTDDAPAASLIPTWLISDLKVTCSTGYRTVYLSCVYLSGTIVSVGVSGCRGDGTVVGLLTKTVTRDELEPFRSYSMERISDDAAGVIAFGEIPADATPFKLNPTHEQAPVVQSAIVQVETPGVTKIIDSAHGTEATGIIDLSGNSEFRTTVDERDPSTIVITLSDTYRDLTTSVCDAIPSFEACGRTPVKTINGVPPDDNGVIRLRFR
jgi:hypothetical protein